MSPSDEPEAGNYGDPSSKLWSMHLTEAKEEDAQTTKKWSEQAGETLVFTGLFSAIVAAFLMESYKKLSPDSGEQTVALLTQLINISNGAPVVVQSSPPFKPPASIVRVNVMWFLSLILSLSSALLATLMQQWARRYMVYAQRPGAPQERARIRSYMLGGVKKFGFSQGIDVLPLLHISVFFFFAGLIDFLLPINKVVAFSTLGCGAVFALQYATLTLLPTLYPDCPYHTPLTEITYTSFQLSAAQHFSAFLAIEGVFHGLLLKMWRRFHPNVRGSLNDGPTKWRAMLEYQAYRHYRQFSHGLRWSVELGAKEAPPWVDASALHWTLTTLNDEKKLEDFAALMPGFFNSRASPNATLAMLSLLSERRTPQPILGSRLLELLNTCLPEASLLTEEQRKHRLCVCLKSLWYCARAYDLPENSEVPLATYVHANFANPEVIGWIQTEQDIAIRLLGRCFWSLVVKKLENDIASRTRTGIAAITEEEARLSYILGATDEQVKSWLGQEGAIGLANVNSLASRELEVLVASGTGGVPADVVDVFLQTLSILAEGIVSSHADDLPPGQVARFHEIYSKLANAQVPKSLKKSLRKISDRMPLSASDVKEGDSQS